MDPSHKARVLDMGVIATLKELGGEEEPELFIELVDLFLEDAKGNVRALREVLERDLQLVVSTRASGRARARVAQAVAHLGAGLVDVLRPLRREVFDQTDAKLLERTAHTLKSSCGNVGALGLSDACFRLEQLGRAGRLDGAESIIESALIEFEQVCQALNSEKV